MAASKLTPHQQRQILLGILLVIGVVGWVNFFFLPLTRRLSEMRPQVQELQRRLMETREDLKNLPATEAELARLAAQYELPAAASPPEEQVPELLKAIAQMARNAQVRLLEVTPKAQLDSSGSTPSGYLELPVEVQASAGYHPLGHFLDALEHSKSLVRVQEFEILPDPQDLWHHKAVILLQAYLVPGAKKKGS